MALRQEHDRADTTASSLREEPEVVHDYPSTGVTTVLLALFVVFVAGIIVLAQNTTAVTFQFIGWEADTPLFVLLLTSFAVGSLATLAAAGTWRHRRRRTRREHEELQRLRRERDAR